MRTKDGSYPPHAPGKAARLKEDSPTPAGRPSSLLDTRVIYCGDCLDQFRKLPDACVDLIYIDPPFKFQPQLRSLLGRNHGESLGSRSKG